MFSGRSSFVKNAFPQRNVTLLISLPKNSGLRNGEVWDIDKTREAIAQMESFLNTIAGIKEKESEPVTFEIVSMNKEIFFYFIVAEHRVDYLKQNLHAVFSEAHIEEQKSYNIFKPHNVARGAMLRFTRDSALPLRTYTTLDTDPLNALTNALSKLEENESAVIQYTFKSAPKKWRQQSIHIAQEMQKGESYKTAVKESRMGAFGSAMRIIKGPDKKKKTVEDQYEHRQLSPEEVEMVKEIEQKTSKAGLVMNVRILVATDTEARADAIVTNISNAFSHLNSYQFGNKLEAVVQKDMSLFIKEYVFRKFKEQDFVVNTEEAASLFHFPLPNTETPNIHWLTSKKAPPPINLPKEGIIIGENVYRNKKTLVRISEEDRRRHAYIIGMTGVGKSVLMQNMARQDIEAGKGVAIIDPHGDFAETILSQVPESRMKDVIYLNPADLERPIGLNMLEADDIHQQDFAIQEMIQIFYKMVSDPAMIGPMFEHNMRNAMLTLMADKKDPGTIADIPRMFSDPAFQKHKLQFVTDPMVRAFWEQEMAKTSDFHKSEMLGYLISKVGKFIENQMMRNIIGQPKSGFDFNDVMNNEKILIVNLSKGKIGETNSKLLGLIIVSKLEMAALARADMPEDQRKDFYLYIDEFQNYTTDSIATILSEARKYRLILTMAHQYLGQLRKNNDTSIFDAVMGNVGTMISFRIGVEDAETMAKQFEPTFNEYDLMNVDKYNAFMRTLVDNAATKPFNITTIAPKGTDMEKMKRMVEFSRKTYGRPKAEVEEEILKRSKLGQAPPAVAPAQTSPPASK